MYSAESLQAALSLAPAPTPPDVLELRVDHFASAPEALRPLATASSRPLILTVRDPREGGAAALNPLQRKALYEAFLPEAAFVDLEIRSLAAQPMLGEVAATAQSRGCRVIGSFHDFEKTPSLPRLRALANQARVLGVDIFKLATRLHSPADLGKLLSLLESESRSGGLPVAAMGMGEALGRVSRLALAAAGSVLNYGYLGEAAQLPGQWPAARLRELLDELLLPPPV